LLAPCFMLISCFASSSTLKMEAIYYSKMLLDSEEYAALYARVGCAVAQAVSLRVRAWVASCGICGGLSGTGTGFP
jgi:hypothetical protein